MCEHHSRAIAGLFELDADLCRRMSVRQQCSVGVGHRFGVDQTYGFGDFDVLSGESHLASAGRCFEPHADSSTPADV